MKRVIVYTDGACSGNPGPGGWGAIILRDSIEKELCGGEPDTTNNRMEMISAIRALEELENFLDVELYTDSQYLINGITKWISSWEKNNWMTSTKKAVKNKELWIKLRELSKRHKISWKWVAGHSGNKYNERVDRLARSQCKKLDRCNL
ncbi:MAG: ribonuclease HI [Holosporaceae bacterium]|jgi:ribonuclease HI|nr:ribonuclease HI [Holosporaceae bacterium]